MAKLLLNIPEGPSIHLELHSGRNRLGRNETNDFPIEDPSVSGFHCELHLLEAGLFVTDLGSTNGTYIDGELIKEGELRPGQTLELGRVKLLWELPPVEISIPPLPAPPPVPVASFLNDGSPACLHHFDVPAHLKCTKCENCFCDACVRVLRRAGGRTLSFCPDCGGSCDVLTTVRPRKQKAKTFFSLLEKTLKIPFKRDQIEPE